MPTLPLRSPHRVSPLLVGSALLLSACGGGGASTVPTGAEAEAIRQEVRQAVQQYQDATSARDTAAIRALYVPDERFRWLEDGRQAYRTVDQVIESIGALPAEMTITTEFINPDITPLRSDLALVATDFRTAFVPTDPESEMEGFSFQGVISVLFERGPDGWRIVTGHTSTANEP